jgi:hypothetical protein
LRDFDFEDACPRFVFDQKNNEQLIFFTQEEIFKFDYMDEGADRVVMYTLKNTLDDPARFGVFNTDNSKVIICSVRDILYVDL